MSFQEGLHDLCQAHAVAAVYFFDAPPGGGGDREGAQVGVVFAGPREVSPALVEAFRDLLAGDGGDRVSVVDLERVDPVRRFQVIRGRLVYSADEERRTDFEERSLRDYQDFAFELRLFAEEAAEEIEIEEDAG
jgi:hypothetical protein